MNYGFERYLFAAILFASGLLFPPLFLLFLPIVALSAYRALQKEYREVFVFWSQKGAKMARKIGEYTKKPTLKPAAEMV